ncbi:hypothetical protein SELMODRAFT_91152 [Selaginella moellendorffii]|uniref:RING-type E3 ubiquitin transferase n=1 Tax=Selaginella moellendorffii TaxID=88036 RepID=D8RCK0_SELML|nr:E3 ubiquitin-protein ligase SPL2 [Selaginella moellendorffii]EFJ29866.1 hypothetical protein SELMODRAFT_91152 [Selaginella moellendorffii]|eukprot:XP_002968750.1 E3 ubiquitin-protein ligase SPL2 [Selaginella moellendorffii]
MASHDEEICAALTRLAMAGDGIVLGLGMAALALRTWLKFGSHTRALKQVEGTAQVEIHDLRSLVESGEKEPSSDSSPPLVIVRGRVALPPKTSSEEVLLARNQTDLAVFVERTQTYLFNEWRGLFRWGPEWRGLLGWGSLKEQVAFSRRKIPFVLLDSDPQYDGACVHINMENVEHPLPLVTVFHQLHPVQTSSSTFLQAVFGRRYPVGVIDEEKILPLNREITAVGFLSKHPQGLPAIKSSNQMPFFLTEFSREELIVELASATHALFWTGIVISSLALGVIGYSAFKNWCKWKEWRRLRQIQEELRREEQVMEEDEEPATTQEGSEVPDGQLCVVCLLRRKRAAFITCGHRVCCMGCARRIRHSQNAANARCPVCRQSVSGYIRVYD